MTALEAARAYVAAGLSVIPIRPDGAKRPALDSWKEMEQRLPTEGELSEWFSNGCGVAVVCGRVSRNLAVLDFDSAGVWEGWKAKALAHDPHCLDGVPMVRTPRGGRHLYLFRDVASPTFKVAKDADGRTLVEVKAEGGYVLAPGCPPGCHPSGRTYEWLAPLAGAAALAGV